MEYRDVPYNKMAFTPEEAEQCADFIKYLMQMKSSDYYNEICISSDGYCTIVYWIHKPHDNSYGGSFEFVNENDRIMHELALPDGTYTFCSADWEEREIIEDFLKNHPDYEYDPYTKQWHKKVLDNEL